ncbi:hypothetical protein AD01_5045 [Escherichia coli 2-427-07_S4_C2]|nr:hypothetical protein CSC38_0968 [Escherichia coli]KDY20725.1 hypothetical protein AD30_1474 [Escherichia coli 2-316-03_S4_C3]KDY40205.1 hypothetical protein AD01_5045 [Escherichia coli 2-427-07_S4_C2]KEJ60425.1 hypothetical protein AC85_1675 [Escherichia coli 3-020-07_S4_C1]KEO42821.1 hypothetical protein AB34_5386 [Escherichia coli 2-460-02_S1_C2]CDL03025.1 hypothetical protein [Escherichia coli IS35]CDL44955.1 hypothetical protein [Escherichia coli ISC41]
MQNQHYDRNHFQYYQLLITVFTLPTDWDTKTSNTFSISLIP